MKPSPFEYVQPATTDEAVTALRDHDGEAKVLAGGQSLVPLLNYRLAAPACLVDINGIEELQRSEQLDGTLRLGALTRHREIEHREDVAVLAPLLQQAVRFVGHPQIRSRGTLGGTLAHADPSAELPSATLALDGVIVARSVRGERRIPAGDFFRFHFSTALEDDELVTAVEYPVAGPREGSAFLEVAARYGDFALAGAAAVVRLDADGRIEHARVVCASVGPAPVRVSAAEDLLVGRTLTRELLDAVQETVTKEVDPTGEHKASVGYKRRTAGVLARRAVEQAAQAAARRTS